MPLVTLHFHIQTIYKTIQITVSMSIYKELLLLNQYKHLEEVYILKIIYTSSYRKKAQHIAKYTHTQRAIPSFHLNLVKSWSGTLCFLGLLTINSEPWMGLSIISFKFSKTMIWYPLFYTHSPQTGNHELTFLWIIDCTPNM